MATSTQSPGSRPKIVICALGTKGDLFPVLALGRELVTRGYDCDLLSNEGYAELASSHGLRFIPVTAAHTKNLVSGVENLDHHVFPSYAPTFEYFRQELAQRRELLVVNLDEFSASNLMAEQHGLSVCRVVLAPSKFRSVLRPAWPLNKHTSGPLKLSYQRYRLPQIYEERERGPAVLSRINPFRARLGLRPLERLSRMDAAVVRHVCFFPEWFGLPQPDWPQNVALVGFPLPASNQRLDPELEAFLEREGKPLVFTPGTGVVDVHEFFDSARRCCERLSRPGVFLSPHYTHPELEPGPKLYFARFVDLQLLLRRSSLLVHHGGIGTTARALEAGVPQIIRSVAYDQPDNGERVAELGAGAFFEPGRWEFERMLENIESLLTSVEVRHKLADLKHELAGTDAVGAAADVVERIARPPAAAGTTPRRLLVSKGTRGQQGLLDVMLPLAHGPRLRVALVNPPQSYPVDLADEFQSYFPVGLAMLAAVLREMRIDVKVIDCLAWHERTLMGSSVVFGMPRERLCAELQRFAPHVVGIGNPFSSFIEDALTTARLVKHVDPKIQVVLGGAEPSLAPNNRALLENNPALDVLVRGEGEVTICDLMARYDLAAGAFVDLAGVEGLLFRGPNGVCETPQRPFLNDLDQLPLPAYDLLDMTHMYENPYFARHRMRAKGSRCLPMHTSRGCPYSCTFCSVHSQVGKPNRRHSPSYVVRHMRHVMALYGVRHFHFEDDNLTLHGPRARELFEAIKPLSVTWDTPNGLRADTITRELAVLMAASGATSVTIAVESGDQRVLNDIVKKNLDLEHVVRAAAHLRSADIPTLAFFIVGFPGEREAEVRTTLEFAKALALHHSTLNLLFVATPLPGTPLERECLQKGYFIQSMNNRTLLSAIRLNQTPLIATEDFSKADLFLWAKSVLDTPEVHTIGEHIPLFMAATREAVGRAKRLFGISESVDWAPGARYWRRPHNNPPTVLRTAETAAE